MTRNRLECWVFRAPTPHPVRTSFGVMHDRPAVFLRVTAPDGAWGWGEVFCNFPQVGAEHRARLATSIFSALLADCDLADPPALWRKLEAQTRRIALQCGEAGPFAQVISAIDQAAWDMAARRQGKPLWQLLAPPGQLAEGGARVYASGLGPERVVETARAKHEEGYRAFKFKVGFGPERDRQNFRALRAAIGQDAVVMVDANQAWEPEIAVQRIAELAEFSPYWIEEPIAADEPVGAWQSLARASGVPLAAGENLRGELAFSQAIDAGALQFLQPDVAKWGGISGCRAVALLAMRSGLTFCPHWLGGGVGLAASLHLRAALGSDGYAEVDANPNPLREEVCPWQPEEGWIRLPQAAGIGLEPDLAALKKYQVPF